MPYASGIPQEATVSSFLAIGEYIFASTDQYGIYRIIEGNGKWFRIDLDLPEHVDLMPILRLTMC